MESSSMIEAKKEYTSQLQQILSPRVYERFKYIFDGTIEVIKQELSLNKIQSESVIKIFQKQLTTIKDWNESNIIEEYERIKNRSKCNYIEKLIKAVIIANMKILTTIQYGNRRKNKIQVHIPTPTHFIHKCYVECAKEIYKNPYIFDMSIALSAKEKHQNLRDSLILIDNGIQSAIRQLLPIGDLLEQNFNSDDEDDIEEEQSGGNRDRTESNVSSLSSASSDASSDYTSESESENSDESSISTQSSASIQSSLSAASSASAISSTSGSVSLASKVESTLNNQNIDDIDIRIGGDSETQSMLENVVEERAENHISNVTSEPSTFSTMPSIPSSPVVSNEVQTGGSGVGGFLGALYTTFANPKNISTNATDVAAPQITAPSPTYNQTTPSTEELKSIVFTGGAVPKGFNTSPLPPTPVVQNPVIQSPVVQNSVVQSPITPLFNMNQSIYPPKNSSSSSIKSGSVKSGSSKKIIKTIHHSLQKKAHLSLREQKYGNGLSVIDDNASIGSSGSEGFHF